MQRRLCKKLRALYYACLSVERIGHPQILYRNVQFVLNHHDVDVLGLCPLMDCGLEQRACLHFFQEANFVDAHLCF